IRALVERLDERPPMVVIQVLIAELNLNSLDQFGVTTGIQDGLLFTRGSGFNFLTSAFPPAGSGTAADQPTHIATRGVSNIGVPGTTGLIIGASSESFEFILQALRTCAKT